ncbi:hypothetical protein SAMN05444409_0242 [Epilithonimonas zeae]|uniref:Uncharacterized protein n=1 Tax=Epilithonimonas zeae TaxID=1416779 RepID=A0A1N6E2N9_9FLAO|nr:hypothetical protein SAMN05444409_0242 [Epilithonimonas zeae]
MIEKPSQIWEGFLFLGLNPAIRSYSSFQRSPNHNPPTLPLYCRVAATIRTKDFVYFFNVSDTFDHKS